MGDQDLASLLCGCGVSVSDSPATPHPHAFILFSRARAAHSGGPLLSRSSLATQSLYAETVNPQWVRLLDLLGMNVRYQRCEGCELYAEDGTRYLDFLSGLLRAQHRPQPSAHHRSAQTGARSLGPGDAAKPRSRTRGGTLATTLCSRRRRIDQDLLLQLRQRRRGGGHQVRARYYETERASVLRGRVSRPDLRRVVDDGQSLLERRLRPAACRNASDSF